MRLIDYTSEYLSLIDAMSYEDNELAQEEIAKRLDAIEEVREDKLERCAWVYREYLAEESSIDVEIERLKVKKQRAGRNAERLKNYIAFCLNGEKTKTKSFDFSFRKSEAVIITNEEKLPLAYKKEKITYVPDKDLIKADIKNGASIPGALVEVRQNIQIK